MSAQAGAGKKIRRVCPECGHVTCVYSHHLNAPIVSALRALVDFYEDRRRPANLQKDLPGLTKNQFANFQKLQYFFLAQRVPGQGWVPKREGIDFVYGRTAIRDLALTFGRSILGYEHRAWADRKIRTVRVWDVDSRSYKKPPEYKAEKSGPPAQPALL